jgi:benzoyl-CoA reductase/2-hydroxyglutaryl-CoA dehydratase subunit BcrC/BadD/HgdB
VEVFVTSPWVPVEWIKAHGLEPRGAWFAKSDQPVAVPEGVCAFAQEMASLAEAHPHAAVVFTTACDQMRRAADAVAIRTKTRRFLFNLPATWQSPAARRFYHAELARLGKFLVTHGGRVPTDAELESVIREHEARRAALRDLIQRSSTRQAAKAMARFFDDGSPRGSLHEPSARSGVSVERRHSLESEIAALCRDAATAGVPLALVGGPLLPSQWPLFDAIETAGGRVVLNATEPGERCLLPPLPNLAPEQKPLVALADHYFDHAVDVFHRPNSRLYAWLEPRLAERRVRGIVLWVHVGCDLWRAEAATLREAFGLPVLVLDAHEVRAGGLRDTNRLAAFIESLQ